MNAHVQWRLEFARTLSTELQQFADIQTIAVLGSVARRYSDAYSDLSAIHCSLFLVLLALNESYFPTFKWMYPVLQRMPRTPLQLAERLRSMFYEPPIQAAAQLRAVLTETVEMVEAAYPDLDTTYARYGLDQEPQVFTRPLSL